MFIIKNYIWNIINLFSMLHRAQPNVQFLHFCVQIIDTMQIQLYTGYKEAGSVTEPTVIFHSLEDDT